MLELSRKLLRMRGKGIVGLNNSGEGDQYVRVNVYIPKDLNNAEKKSMRVIKRVR